jgi:Peptidase family M1 domain
MKPFLFAFLFLFWAGKPLAAQSTYWQQKLNYRINVSLNPSLQMLQGHEEIDYINHSPDTLNEIWIHIWANAYSDESTALYKQVQADKELRKKMKKNAKGWIDSLQFTINGKKISYQEEPGNKDIIRLPLPVPLAPGDTATIATPFRVKLPAYFSRSGFSGDQFMICQWFPKPAVYDTKGWHTFPYLDQGEFYGEYGSFSVNINLPSHYVVAATGSLQTAAEAKQYRETGIFNALQSDHRKYKKYEAIAGQPSKLLEYRADSVHDFAWFADPDFIIQYDTLQWATGRITDVFTYRQPGGNPEWQNSLQFVKDAVKAYSGWLGEYPYPVVQAVEGPSNESSGGMEYPMVTLITSPGADGESLDAVITHEVGHNWFYGILGSNERDYPWMDEGLNTYYQFRYEAEKYRANSIFGKMIPAELRKLEPGEFLKRIYPALNTLPAREPINTSSTQFANKEAYSTVVYIKTAIWFFLFEQGYGRETVDQGMKAYFNEWKFRHPQPENLKAALEKAAGRKLDDWFALLQQEGNFR